MDPTSVCPIARALVFEISLRDPWTFAGVVVVLLATGFVETWPLAA